jgi:hypothetical protein
MFAVFILLLGPLLGARHQTTAGHLRWTLNSGRTLALVLWGGTRRRRCGVRALPSTLWRCRWRGASDNARPR